MSHVFCWSLVLTAPDGSVIFNKESIQVGHAETATRNSESRHQSKSKTMKKVLFTFLLAGVFGFANAASNNADESSMNHLPETGIIASSLVNPEPADAQDNFDAVPAADFFDCRVEGTITVKDEKGVTYTVRFVIIFKDVSCVELVKEVLKK